jgi:hypothetical protein
MNLLKFNPKGKTRKIANFWFILTGSFSFRAGNFPSLDGLRLVEEGLGEGEITFGLLNISANL